MKSLVLLTLLVAPLLACNEACPNGLYISPPTDCRSVCVGTTAIAECADTSCRTGSYRRLTPGGGWEEGGFVFTERGVRPLWTIDGPSWSVSAGVLQLEGKMARQVAVECTSAGTLLSGDLSTVWQRPTSELQQGLQRAGVHQ
jgi:hypothetical protein